MKSFFKYCLPLLATALLASCGGGGNDGHAAFEPPPPPPAGQISLSAVTTSLPLNSVAALPNPGGPFTTEVTITVRRADGSLATAVETVGVSINPASVATFSTLDDPETQDINEILLRLGQAPVDVVAGKATVFVTAFKTAGAATLTVSTNAAGNNDGGFNSASLEFDVGGTDANLPVSMNLHSADDGVYLASSGGRSTTMLTASVTDAGGLTVPDAGAPNIQFEVLGGANSGTLIWGSQSGDVIQLNTTKGVAQATFKAGTVSGPVMIKATADGADNDVSNGIAAPVSAKTTILVSNGQLYSLEITSPLMAANLPGITVNSLPVAEDVNPAPGSTSVIPPNPNATLSLVVTALATDRQGNPVLPGTPIHFGSVDEPVWSYNDTGVFVACDGNTYTRSNTFKLSGCHGDPEENGTLFTASGAHFTIVPGGGPQDSAAPGDALLVFGKNQPFSQPTMDNAPLESALTIANVNSATSLTTVTPFNTTVSGVDNGPVLPWIVGRSMHGNITASGTTNELGVTSVKLTYTVNTVGHAVAIWAQGAGNGRVTDLMTLTYPGVAPAILTAFPDPLPGNATTQVTACLTGALGIPLRGVPVNFQFDLAAGSGTLDGTPSAGVMAHVTGADGCATGTVTTTGLSISTAGGNSGSLILSAAGAEASVDFKVGVGFLSIAPGGQICAADGADIRVTAYDTGNPPAPLTGVTINASCTNSVSISPASGTTNGSGGVLFHVTNTDPQSGVCTFTGPDGLSVQMSIRGVNDGFSPACKPSGTP